jgi:hypothetical protein
MSATIFRMRPRPFGVGGAHSAAQTLAGLKFADAANESLRLSAGRRDRLITTIVDFSPEAGH